jgi:hypothetical protein
MASNLVPGTQQYGTIETARGIGGMESITQDPSAPVEYGRTAAGSKYTTTASSGAEIPDQGA